MRGAKFKIENYPPGLRFLCDLLQASDIFLLFVELKKSRFSKMFIGILYQGPTEKIILSIRDIFFILFLITLFNRTDNGM